MRLFILAAGTGSRLLPLTKSTPKVLLKLDGKTCLLDRQIENAIESKYIHEIVIISGYLGQQIKDHVKTYQEKIDIKTIYNPFYNVSNNLMSLWTVHHLMNEQDFLITNGDNMYDHGVIDQVIDQSTKSNDGIFLTIDYKDHYDEDDMKVQIDNNNKIQRVHKEIGIEETKAESVGLSIVKGTGSKKLFADKLIELSEDQSFINKFWLEIYNELVKDNIPIEQCIIEESVWNEVDFHPDINFIQTLLAKSNSQK